MTFVVDASVAIKWLLEEDGSDAALQLFESDELAAPELWLSECANALWKAVGRRDISAEAAEALLGQLVEAKVSLHPLAVDVGAALTLATDLRHPVYDCLYLALAIRLRTAVVTADRRFVEAVRPRPALASHIRLLGD